MVAILALFALLDGRRLANHTGKDCFWAFRAQENASYWRLFSIVFLETFLTGIACRKGQGWSTASFAASNKLLAVNAFNCPYSINIFEDIPRDALFAVPCVVLAWQTANSTSRTSEGVIAEIVSQVIADFTVLAWGGIEAMLTTFENIWASIARTSSRGDCIAIHALFTFYIVSCQGSVIVVAEITSRYCFSTGLTNFIRCSVVLDVVSYWAGETGGVGGLAGGKICAFHAMIQVINTRLASFIDSSHRTLDNMVTYITF